MSDDNLGPVTEAHKFDEPGLARYLAGQGMEGFAQGITVRQYQGGQSNPTFMIEDKNDAYVLRKKPPGVLLPSAHMVEREYRVMKGLAGTGVPVPTMHVLCEDESVIGTKFFIMQHLHGRILTEPDLPEATSREERTAIYDSLGDVLAKLHQVDYQAVGLGEFGRPQNYVTRQIDRWSKQFEATKTDPMPDMDALTAWLPEHHPEGDETSIVHGDYRLGNVILHPTEPRVIAVLDWELSTLGHPLSDLAYYSMVFRTPPDGQHLKGVAGMDLEALGIPAEDSFVTDYCRRTGRDAIPEWKFYLAFNFFRLAAICQGVYYRGIQGNASSTNAVEVGAKAPVLAKLGWEVAKSV